MKKVKRIISLLLVICMATVITAGCGKGKDTDTNGKNDDSSSVMGGRYKEDEINLPDAYFENSENGLNPIRKADGTIEFFAAFETQTGTGIAKYTLNDDESWQREEYDWPDSLDQFTYEQADGLHVVWGADGQYYMYYYGADNLSHVARVTAEQSIEQIAIKELEEEYKNLDIGKVKVAESGEIILIIGGGDTVIYDGATGEKIANVMLSGAFDFAIDGESIWLTDGKVIQEVNIKNGEVLNETAELDTSYSGYEINIYAKQGGKVYISTQSGIDCIEPGGKVWERLVDGDGSILSDSVSAVTGFFANSDEEFVGFFKSSSSSDYSIIRFRYMTDEELADLNEIVLKIYTMEESKTLRNAVSHFKQLHPEVKININVAAGDEDTSRSDLIKTLNTEVFSGKGPDIIMMDGLPTASYIEKGALVDLSDVLAEMKDELLPNIVTALEAEDIYMIPARIGMPYAAGEQEAVGNAGVLKALADNAGNTAQPYFQKTTYEELMKMIYHGYSNDIINEDGMLNKAALSEYLEAMDTIAKKSGIDKYAAAADEQRNTSLFEVAAAKTSLHLGVLDGMNVSGSVTDSATELFAVINKINGTYSAVNDTFIARLNMAVSSKCEEQELAKEFIKLMLSEEVQKNDFGEGFAINENALNSCLETESKDTFGVSGPDSGEMLTMEWPQREELERIISDVKGLSKLSRTNDIILDMIMEQGAKMFNSDADISTIAAEIENKVNLYMAE